MSPRRRRTLFSAFALSLACLAGCKPAERGDKTSAAGVASYPETDYRETEKGRAGGVLRVSVSSDTGTLDLHAISHTNAQWLGRILYDNLVYRDSKGNVTPWLAKSWEISPDGKTYTFRLRDDVTFSDGAKFDADAVLVNLEHMRAPATKSPLAAAYIAPYDKGEAVDPYTVRLHLREPYAPFLDVLAQSWLAMESPKAIRENPKGIGSAPVGSGPFVPESYSRQQGIRFVKRKDYHWAPETIGHAGPAYLDRIEIEFVPEALLRYEGLLSGRHDFTIDAPAQNAAALRADSGFVFDSRIRQGAPSRALTFNVEKFPVDDPAVRRALARAIDRTGIARLAGFGEFRPKSDFLAANTRYYDPAYAHVLDDDVASANRSLDEAGWKERGPDGIRLKDGKRLYAEILANEALTSGPVIVAVQSDLKKIGFELKIVQLPALALTDRRYSGDYTILSGGVWHTNTPDALYILYHSDEIPSGKRIGQNVSHLRDAVLDDLLARARASGDDAARKRLYSEAQKRLGEIVPSVTVFDNYTLTARSKRVHGVVFDTSHNTVVFTTVWLEEKK